MSNNKSKKTSNNKPIGDGKTWRLRKSDIAKLKESLPKKTELGAKDGAKTYAPISDEQINAAYMETNGITPILEENAKLISVPLTGEEIAAFRAYAALLREYNKVMNLTNIVDDNGIAMRHFIDSLTLVSFIEAEQKKQGRENLSIIDVGTGAGFPGIPLKVSIPSLELTLLDSLKKRVGFLDTVIGKLALTGARTVHSRAEDAGHSKTHREKYDIATARAVASLPTLCEYCLPLVKVGGIFLAMKGHLEEELEQSKTAIIKLGGTIETSTQFVLPGTDMERSIVVIRKVRSTPTQYPRQAGKPSKEPL